ncbi:MAG TPA: hypothetical protein VHQ90_00140 [Thermoanaerobaculia bacterium]|nr:hypothetical protein [Thermoanaerobaculia bacterium]
MNELRRLVDDWRTTADQLEQAGARRRAATDTLAVADMDRLLSIAVAYRSCAVHLERVLGIAAEVA